MTKTEHLMQSFPSILVKKWRHFIYYWIVVADPKFFYLHPTDIGYQFMDFAYYQRVEGDALDILFI